MESGRLLWQLQIQLGHIRDLQKMEEIWIGSPRLQRPLLACRWSSLFCAKHIYIILCRQWEPANCMMSHDARHAQYHFGCTYPGCHRTRHKSCKMQISLSLFLHMRQTRTLLMSLKMAKSEWWSLPDLDIVSCPCTPSHRSQQSASQNPRWQVQEWCDYAADQMVLEHPRIWTDWPRLV